MYASFSVGSTNDAGTPMSETTFGPRLMTQFLLLAIYSIVAVMQWRRVEA
jgi:hypothetical protein